MKRRVLEKLKLTEISGVDKPAIEGATVAIMKRAIDDPNQKENEMDHLEELEGEVTDLGAQVAHLSKKVATVKSFDALAAEIRKRDNCTRTQALVKARAEAPEAFAAYRGGPANEDYTTLIEAEIAKGCPPAVAGQRVAHLYPHLAKATTQCKSCGAYVASDQSTCPNCDASVMAKKEKTPYEKLVDSIIENDGVSRAVAMTQARKQEPAMFAHYQAQ